MKNIKRFACLLALAACDEGGGETASDVFVVRHVQTLAFGAEDNSEVVKLLPSGDKAVLVASKGRKITLLGVTASGLTELQSTTLFAADGGESELTHIDFDSQGRFAAVTHTLPVVTDGQVTDCRGELVFIDVQPGEGFGRILAQVPVGPYPDAVDISDDDRWVVTADEVDFNDGKCPVEGVTGSISVIELTGGDPTAATLRGRITMDQTASGGRREPEQILFGFDSDTVAATLQDTHELVFFKVSALLAGAGDAVVERPVADFTLTAYPNRTDGAEPWPDGLTRFRDASGAEHFLATGEYNDTFAFFRPDGTYVSQVAIAQSDLPSDLPRNLEDWSLAPFRPDSAAAFRQAGKQYVALSLKHAGAVGVWRLDDLAAVRLAGVAKVGLDDTGTATTESSLGTEGIAAAEGGIIITANEGESSASLVRAALEE